MLRFLLYVLLVSCLLASSGCSKTAPDDGTQLFQGTWHGTELRKGGDKTEKQVVFERDTILIVASPKNIGAGSRIEIGAEERCVFRVDRTLDPAHLDFVYLDGENQGKTRPGIFVFEGDTLKICIADFDANRPTEFVAGEKATLMVLERIR